MFFSFTRTYLSFCIMHSFIILASSLIDIHGKYFKFDPKSFIYTSENKLQKLHEGWIQVFVGHYCYGFVKLWELMASGACSLFTGGASSLNYLQAFQCFTNYSSSEHLVYVNYGE